MRKNIYDNCSATGVKNGEMKEIIDNLTLILKVHPFRDGTINICANLIMATVSYW